MQSYDPTEVTVSFSGITISGFAPGTFVKASRNQDTWSYQPSNSGRGARSRTPDKSGKIEITLLWSSATNALLQAKADVDEVSGTGHGDFLVKDRSTLTGRCEAQNAWIIKPPDWERAREVGEVTWTFETDELIISHDGLIDT